MTRPQMKKKLVENGSQRSIGIDIEKQINFDQAFIFNCNRAIFRAQIFGYEPTKIILLL